MDPQRPTGAGAVVEGPCAVCGISSMLRCKACKDDQGIGAFGTSTIVFYCSKEHQAQDWNRGHKQVCVATVKSRSGIVTKINPQIGLIYKAARDLPVGHLLFSKTPLLVLPRAPESYQSVVVTKSQPNAVQLIEMGAAELCTCVGCNDLLLYEKFVGDPMRQRAKGRCGKCSWPLHTRIQLGSGSGVNPCERAHAAECKIFSNVGLTWDKIKSSKNSKLAYSFVGVLRALILTQEDKEEFVKIPLRPEAKKPEDFKTEEIFNWIKFCGVEAPKELVHYCIMKIEANMLPIPYTPMPYVKLGYVVHKAAAGGTGRIFNHSCTPNVAFTFDPISMEGHFKTLRPVKKGEELRLSYLTQFEIYQPIGDRRTMLATLGVSCDCRRCADPATEGGIYTTAIKCPNGADHWFLPRVQPQPHLCTTCSRFECNNKKCNAIKTLAEVDVILGAVRDDFSPEYDALKTLLDKYSGKLVHPNHFMVHLAWIQVGICALKAISEQIDDDKPPAAAAAVKPNYDFHWKYLGDLDRLLKLMHLIHPGRVVLTGHFLFAHSLLLMSKLAEDLTEEVKPGSPPPPKGHFGHRLGKIMEETREAWIIIFEDPLSNHEDRKNFKLMRIMYANDLVAALEHRFEVDGGFDDPNDEDGKPSLNMVNYVIFKDEFADVDFSSI